MSFKEQKHLSPLEREIYSWQVDVDGFGLDGQEKLKNATVLISRCGGLGGVVAYELAAAGVGKMILAHAGNIKPSDLNRQLLMTRDRIGHSRMNSIEHRLKELNPDLEIQACPE
ncbi:MAG TPA: MoeZ/MoeB, partial [Verrucomicrobiales bacterium]|nr:MoeZ/MoeB [Verrucomicrobiales bacterium]